MKYTIAVVEDNIEYQDLIKNYINQYKKEKKLDISIDIFSDGDEITDDYKPIYNIIFFDIEMKRLDGMSAAKKIRTFDQDVIIIFITNMAQYAIKGYAVNALSFVLNPLSYFAFSQELEKSIQRIKNKKENFLIIPIDNGMSKINLSEINYIESIKHYIYIHTAKEVFTIRSTMKKMEEKVSQASFYRCNNIFFEENAT